MYGSGLWSILPIQALLAPVEEAITTVMALSIQRLTARAAIRRTAASTSVSRFHFIKVDLRPECEDIRL